MHTKPIEYVKAFLLTFVIFAAGIAVYWLVVPANGIQIAVLVALSLVLTIRRVGLIQVVEHRYPYEDEAMLLAVIERYMPLKDRWKLVRQAEGFRRYEATLNLGLYRFRAVLEVRLNGTEAVITGHNRVVRGLLYELNHPQFTRMALAR